MFFACDGISGLAVLTALNPFLSLLFVMTCVEFAVPYCRSVGQDSAAARCKK